MHPPRASGVYDMVLGHFLVVFGASSYNVILDAIVVIRKDAVMQIVSTSSMNDRMSLKLQTGVGEQLQIYSKEPPSKFIAELEI